MQVLNMQICKYNYLSVGNIKNLILRFSLSR